MTFLFRATGIWPLTGNGPPRVPLEHDSSLLGDLAETPSAGQSSARGDGLIRWGA